MGAQTRGLRRHRRTSTICSLRSSTPGSTIWRRRRSRWARAACGPSSHGTPRSPASIWSVCRANAIEACEQCGVIWIPEIASVEPLGSAFRELAAGAAAPRLLRRGGGSGQSARCAREHARGRRRRPADRAGRRLRRRRTRRDPLGAARRSPEPRAAYPARGHGRGGGAGAHPGHAWRLAEKAHRPRTLISNTTGRVRHFAATIWLHPGQR